MFEIKPINSKKSYSIVIERILQLIKKNNLKKGDTLPSQKLLARKLGVGIQSVREAYSTLEMCDVIKTKGGTGTIVNTDEVNFFLRPKVLNQLILKEDVMDHFDLSRVIEKESYVLCAKKADNDDIKRIDEALNELVNEYKNNNKFYLDQDRKFHLEIAKSSKNKLLFGLIKYLQTLSDECNKFWQNLIDGKYINEYDFSTKDVEFNEKIFRLIKKRDVSKIKIEVDKYHSTLRKLLVKYYYY